MTEGEDLHCLIFFNSSSFCFDLTLGPIPFHFLSLLLHVEKACKRIGVSQLFLLYLKKIEGVGLSEPSEQEFSGGTF